MAKKPTTILKVPPISRRKLSGLGSVLNNAFANAVLPVIEPAQSEWNQWLEILGQGRDALKCVYCGGEAGLLDHLNAVIQGGKPSGFFAEPGNLVPSCRPCNESRGNTPWKMWMMRQAGKGSESFQGPDYESRLSLLQRFEKWRPARNVDVRKCGDQALWDEYDANLEKLKKLLEDSQTLAEKLKLAVLHDLNSTNS